MTEKILKKLSNCGMPQLENINSLCKLPGSYVNLLARLPNGTVAKILDDDKTYFCAQVEQADDDKCYGIAADENQLAVFLYGENGKDAQIVLWARL